MVAFLCWLRAVLAAVLNGFAKLAVGLVLIFVILLVIGLVRGDGLPGDMVLSLDLRHPIADSAHGPEIPFAARPVTMMDLIFALDAAGRDKRVKGVLMRVGGGLSLAQAEQLDEALSRFRRTGKFVIAQATSFDGAGIGDYLAAAAANQIWVQPKADFAVAGAGAGEIFLRGLFDKIHAVPQIAKRAEYKSAADTFMEKTMTDPDRAQLNAVMQSWYDRALDAVAAERHLAKDKVRQAFEASPQLSDDAKREGLVDKLGYDDDALAAAQARAGAGARPVTMADYIHSGTADGDSGDANIAVIETAGDIVDGTARGNLLSGGSVIAGDDLSATIRKAAKAPGIKAIVLRVDSPGGSVTASDQILHALRKVQAKGMPVVISMAGLAASGGYYISSSANRIVAQPATLTGSIGVLTGKVSVGGTLNMVGVRMDSVSIGKNALMNSPVLPYTPDQWAALNHQADVVYDDFLHKVASGRKLPLDQVATVAKGRVWTGADAKTHGLVDALGGFWTAADLAAKLGGVPQNRMIFRVYPRPAGLWRGLGDLLSQTGATMKAMEGLQTLAALPGVRLLLAGLSQVPQGGVALRATDLPISGN